MPAHRHPVEVVSPMLDSYLARLTLAGYRPRTISARRCVLKAFARSILPRELAEATRGDAEAFLSGSLRPESRRCYRAHLRAFFMWAAEEELIPADPTVRIPRSVSPVGLRARSARVTSTGHSRPVTPGCAAGCFSRRWLV